MKRSAITIGLGLAGFAAAGLAQAACPGATPSGTYGTHGHFLSALYVPTAASSEGLIAIGDFDDAAIVGLWKFEMLSKSTPENKNPMPDGTLIDFGTAAWHRDGTEIMDSGIRNPADNDVCQGVWTRLSESTFKLHHLALAWANGVYTGPTVIQEEVTVDRSGLRFSGNFRIEAYLASETPGHEFDETTKLVTITGSINASRINVE